MGGCRWPGQGNPASTRLAEKKVPVAHAEVLRRLLPNVRVELWDGCGHVPQVEMAERFNAAALTFWAEIDTRPDELPAASLSVGC